MARPFRVAVVTHDQAVADEGERQPLATRLGRALAAAGHEVVFRGHTGPFGPRSTSSPNFVLVSLHGTEHDTSAIRVAHRLVGPWTLVVLLDHGVPEPAALAAPPAVLVVTVEDIRGNVRIVAPARPATADMYRLLHPTGIDLVVDPERRPAG